MSFETQERLDDLQINGLKIYQRPDGYCFTSDAVLLANFATAKARAKVIDFCAGSGVVPILMSAKTKAEVFVGIEIQPRLAQMARRSVEFNGLQDRITIVEGDVVNIKTSPFEPMLADVITCNPPYFRFGGAIENENEEIAVARHEIRLTLEDIARSASRLLKFGGKFFICYPASRIVELVEVLHDNGIEPKVIQPVTARVGKAPYLFLVEALRGGLRGCVIKDPVVNGADVDRLGLRDALSD